ncbi:MAG: DHH family phosphoesterase [Candidatus Methanomethylophilus sp.]|nr:DHH family phosphoesterase [Methanomethylophilus sp.]
MDDYSSELPGKLLSDLRRAAYSVKAAESVTVVTHIDADGITAGVIASETLRRLGIQHTLRFERKITEETVADINSCKDDLVWICDLGSAYMGQFVRGGLVVTDHHVPDPKWRSGQSMLEAFGTVHQLNPHLYKVSGSYEVSGAGMTYLLARTISPENVDLAYLAVIGAIGDFQDTRESQLVGWNRIILDDAVKAGDITVSNGIRYFGRGTRPILQFLQYGEPAIDGVTGNADACMGLLQTYDIQMYTPEGKKRTWMDLSDVERAILTDELMTRTREEDRKSLFGELYAVTRYDPRSCLGDAKEFATTLNSCGRYDDAETGARICEGDMSALDDAENNRRDHRKNISLALAYVRENKLLRRLNHIQYFEAGSAIRETVVGIVAGMILSSSDAVPDMPILAFAEADDGIKVSARAPKSLIDRGLDLSKIMSAAAESVGGMGGGHNVAAGATIPEGKEGVFLEKVDELVADALSP